MSPRGDTGARERLEQARAYAQRMAAWWHTESAITHLAREVYEADPYNAMRVIAREVHEPRQRACRVFEQEQASLWADNARALLDHLRHAYMVSA